MTCSIAECRSIALSYARTHATAAAADRWPAEAHRGLGSAIRLLDRRGCGTVFTSIVVPAELRFGARKLGFSVLSRKLDDGTPIGPNDLLIAALALDLGLAVVTDNVDEFARV